MKVEEIRIGNNFYYKGHIIDFEIGDFTESDNNSQLLELFIKPIPLTEEWLINFGFKYSKKHNEWMCEFGFKIWNSGTKKKPQFYHLNSELLINIEYVHQLQNLYHALIGNELILNK